MSANVAGPCPRLLQIQSTTDTRTVSRSMGPLSSPAMAQREWSVDWLTGPPLACGVDGWVVGLLSECTTGERGSWKRARAGSRSIGRQPLRIDRPIDRDGAHQQNAPHTPGSNGLERCADAPAPAAGCVCVRSLAAPTPHRIIIAIDQRGRNSVLELSRRGGKRQAVQKALGRQGLALHAHRWPRSLLF